MSAAAPDPAVRRHERAPSLLGEPDVEAVEHANPLVRSERTAEMVSGRSDELLLERGELLESGTFAHECWSCWSTRPSSSYHLWNAGQFDGEQVDEGSALGDIGQDLCADGAASAPHVHFSLREYDADLNGWYVSLDGMEIGGWTFHPGDSYYGSATHGSETAYRWDLLYNYGNGGGDPGDPDPPTEAEVVSDGDPVNLRSGPGTGYDVVGTVYDEDPVSIECTARSLPVGRLYSAPRTRIGCLPSRDVVRRR